MSRFSRPFASARLCPIPGMRHSSSLLHRDKNTCASAAKLVFEFEGARHFMRSRYVGSPCTLACTPNKVAYHACHGALTGAFGTNPLSHALNQLPV